MDTRTAFEVKTDIDVYNLFRDKFGDEAAQSLVEYLKSAIQNDSKAIIKEELVSFREKLNGEIEHKIAHECSSLTTKADLAQVEKNVEKSIADTKAELKDNIADTKSELKDNIAKLEVRIEKIAKEQWRNGLYIGLAQLIAIVAAVVTIIQLMIK